MTVISENTTNTTTDVSPLDPSPQNAGIDNTAGTQGEVNARIMADDTIPISPELIDDIILVLTDPIDQPIDDVDAARTRLIQNSETVLPYLREQDPDDLSQFLGSDEPQEVGINYQLLIEDIEDMENASEPSTQAPRPSESDEPLHEEADNHRASDSFPTESPVDTNLDRETQSRADAVLESLASGHYDTMAQAADDLQPLGPEVIPYLEARRDQVEDPLYSRLNEVIEELNYRHSQ